MPVSLVKVAAVLEAAADHLDALEEERASAGRAERQGRIDALADKYAEATGEEMPAPLRAKLAESDKDVVELITSMATKQASAIEALGAPSTRSADGAPKTVKEAADQAGDRFLNWLMS
jgi:hypothetical protein